MMRSAVSRASSPHDLIAAEAWFDCVVCGTHGIAAYENLRDNFFGARGSWKFSRCAAARCAMLWLNPRPLESEIGKAYRDYYTHEETVDVSRASSARGLARAMRQAIKRAYIADRLHYSDHQVARREQMLGLLAYLDPTRRADTDFPLKYLPIGNRGRLLDLGCGSGELLRTMGRFGWQAEGVDPDPAAVFAARRKGCKVRIGSLHEQKFPDESFDAVVMSHVIEHVHHPRELIKEARRILKRERRLVIATPNGGSLGHRMLGSKWPFLDPPRHLQVFTPQALNSLVLAAGFGEVLVSTEIRTAAAMLPRIGRSRFTGRLFEYAESLALHFDGAIGEEIVLVALK